MANDINHPFYHDVIVDNLLIEIRKPLTSQQQQNLQKHHHHQDLIDLLSWNDTNSHIFHSTDSSLSVTSHSVPNDDFYRLKYLIRSVLWPIDHRIRRQLWMNISTINRVSRSKQRRHVSQTGLTTSTMIVENNLNSVSFINTQWPKFVDTTNLCFYHLNETRGRSILHRIISTFALQHPDVTYCPTLQPFSALLLHYHNEYEVLYLINRLLVKNWLCGETHLQWEAYCNVFQKLLRLHYKSAADIIDSRYSKDFYQEWFWWIFRYLPFFYIVKIIDCFLMEGPKLLFRVSLTLVHLYTKRIKRQSNENHLTMTNFCQQISIPIDQILRIAFHIRNFKRRTIEQLIEQEEKLLRGTRQQTLHDDIKSKNSNTTSNLFNQQILTITPQHQINIPTNSMLNQEQFLILWNWLPVRLSISQPMLVFTTEEHGFRLQTLLNKIDELEYSLLIVKATNGEIFGAFCAGQWSDRHKRTYFGFGESFLFTLVPKETRYPWVGQQSNDSNRQNQAKREMFLFVNNEKLIIGGGNGDGLCIDQNLCEGLTTHCDTFDNQPLCSQTYFSISTLEMIAFDFSSS
ncbi:hypothetical protein I4U23_000356 [Adineta vaga]|nr:hypothetical protein I4U23_000356 [Adineta vaga]